MAAYLLESGDVLFNEGGDRDKLGRGWIWEGQIPKCLHQNHVFRARLVDQSLLNGHLISHWGNTFGQGFFLAHGTQTTNLASINKKVLSRLPVPVPPIEEQSEIISELEDRLISANKLEATLEQQLVRSLATRNALLSEAFAGRLVPQDPNDEPASVLFECTRAISKSEIQKRRTKGMQKNKSRANVARRPLLDILREHNKPMTPEELFHEAKFEPSQVDLFYRELASLRDKLQELKPTPSEARMWPFGAHVVLQLKERVDV